MSSRHLIAAGAFALALACSGGSGTQLSVSAKAIQTATTPTTTGGSGAVTPTSSVTVDGLRVLVRKLKLEGQVAPASGTPATTTTTSGRTVHDADEDGSTSVEREGDHGDEAVLGPFVVALSGSDLAGGLVQVLQENVPAGTYHEIKFVVGPYRAPATAATPPDVAAMNGASVVVDGTITDTSGASTKFTFVSSLCAEIEKEDLVVVGGSASTGTTDGGTGTAGGRPDNLTLTIDPSSWFKDANGAVLDPTVAANRKAIEANIKASIDAFEDDDRHGDDDHGDDHGDGGHHDDGRR